MPTTKRISNNIQQVILDNPRTEDKSLVWVNVSNAGKNEIEYLRKNYGFDLRHLRASSAKSMAQRPTIALGENYIFLILHFPVAENGTILAGEIDFFLSQDYLITIHNDNIKPLNDFFNLAKKDGSSLMSYESESALILLAEVVERLMLACYTHLDDISIDINRMEDVIFAQEQKRAVTDILVLRRNIINFRKIMQNHKDILGKLADLKNGWQPVQEFRYRIEKLVDHSKTIWRIIDNQREMIEVLNSTNESLLNYRLSDIMKTLTIFSVIVFPLTLVAAIFSMRTEGGMPFADHPHGFWIIIGLMATGMLGMLLFFKKKKWL